MKELFIIDHISLIKTGMVTGTEPSSKNMDSFFIKMNNIRKVYKYRNIRKQKISKIFETN